MTTLQQTVVATLLKLGTRTSLNRLTSGISDSDTSVVLEYSRLPSAGGRLSIGLEDLHVWTVADLTAVVERGMGGSTAADADVGALVYVDAEYSWFEVAAAVNEVLRILPGLGVVQFKTVDLTADASVDGYDLTSVAELLRVHRVSYEQRGGRDLWPIIPSRLWSVQQKSATGSFASGESLTLYKSPDPGSTVRVLYQAPFTSLALLTSDLEVDGGLPAYIHPLVPIGAAYRLLLSRAPSRGALDAQGDTRRPGEVSVNDSRSLIGSLFSEWTAELQAAKKAQTRKYGV